VLVDLLGYVREQSPGGAVAQHEQCRDALDAGCARTSRESLGERGSHPTVLPVIEHRARAIGPRRISGHTVVACDGDALAGRRIEGNQRIGRVVIDVA
jgi:hypothetical protein